MANRVGKFHAYSTRILTTMLNEVIPKIVEVTRMHSKLISHDDINGFAHSEITNKERKFYIDTINELKKKKEETIE